MDSPTPRRVRVWFGQLVICSHIADLERAERYATLVARRYAGLRVTIDDAPTDRDGEPLPPELLWDLSVN